MNKIKLGIIGLGNMGSGHIRNICAGKCPRVEIAAICDCDRNMLPLAQAQLVKDGFDLGIRRTLRTGKRHGRRISLLGKTGVRISRDHALLYRQNAPMNKRAERGFGNVQAVKDLLFKKTALRIEKKTDAPLLLVQGTVPAQKRTARVARRDEGIKPLGFGCQRGSSQKHTLHPSFLHESGQRVFDRVRTERRFQRLSGGIPLCREIRTPPEWLLDALM